MINIVCQKIVMKRLLISLLLFSSLIFTACQSEPPAPTPARGLGGAAKDQETETTVPTITLSESSGGPNAAVLVSGEDFPPAVFVEIRLGNTAAQPEPFIYAQVQTDEIGSFATSLTMPTLWPGTVESGRAELVVEAKTLTEPALTAEAPFTLEYANAFQTYENELGGFTLSLPADWQVSDPLNTPLGTMFLLGREPLIAGDPAVSTILISDSLTPARAAEQLSCGGGCLEEIRLERLDWNGQPLYKTDVVSEGSPTLEWYFFPQDGRLIYWTLHDPVTFAPLVDLRPTFISKNTTESEAVTAAEGAGATHTPTTAPAETPTPIETPTPTITPSVTPDPFANINADAGPIQITTDFLLALIRQQIFTVAEAQPVLNPDYATTFPANESLLALLQIDELFQAFSLSRLQTGGVVVRLELTLVDGEVVERFVILDREADEGVWRIIGIVDEEDAIPLPTTGTAEPTAVSSPTGEAPEETIAPTVTATAAPSATPTPVAAATEESTP